MLFEHWFGAASEGPVFFAFAHPYPYSRYLQLMQGLEERAAGVYCSVLEIGLSCQRRPIHLVTLTDPADSAGPEEEDDLPLELFTHAHKNPLSFDKPTIFITARVHPGEAPSSFLAESIINLLINTHD